MSKQLRDICVWDSATNEPREYSKELKEKEEALNEIMEKVKEIIPEDLYKALESSISATQTEYEIEGYMFGFKRGLKLMAEALR